MAGRNQLNTKIFMSYRNREPSIAEAQNLAQKLQDEYGYDVFLDTEELRGGEHWKQSIYDNVRDSDVLIVLLQPETADSEWVQREVDVARGAGVAILPIDITRVREQSDVNERVEYISASDVQAKLAISETQYELIEKIENNFDRFVENIERLSKQSRDGQSDWIKQLSERRRVTKASNNPSFAPFRTRDDAFPCNVHLATGDMSMLKNIDVLVNSENDYMQMARIYEANTLSSVLRREGSLFQHGRLIEDTIQTELDDLIDLAEPRFGRPFQIGQVIATHAGHPQSNLVRKNRARFIFHAATVRIDVITMQERLSHISTSDGIRLVVANCLNTILEVDASRGMISPASTKRATAEESPIEKYTPIRSIAFPVFGTGSGGRPVIEVAPAIISGVHEFLVDNKDNDSLQLEDIHVVIFSESDIPFAKNAFLEHFDEI